MPNFTSPDVRYYRINDNNTTLAQSNLGTGTPTEEITAPSNQGKFSSFDPATKIVTGTAGSTFQTLWEANMYLFYNDATTGEYKLVGQILEITDNTHLKLTSATLVNNGWVASTSNLYAGYALITTNESIYIRIQTVGSPTAPNGTRYIPDFGSGKWRQNDNLIGRNKPQQTKLERISIVGTPLSNATPQVDDVAFTFVTMNLFDPSPSSTPISTKYWGSSASLPQYIWIKATPSTQDGISTSLASQTMYRFVTQEYTAGIQVQANTAGTDLSDAGYINVGGNSTTGNNSTGQN